jgi:peptidyl-Asp metalloendopeptidase
VNESRVTLVAEDGVLSGNVNLNGATYQIRYDGGAQIIREVDQRLYPPDKPAVSVRAPTGPSAGASGATPAVSADDGSTIDVMVVYTATARQAAGGTTAMNSLVELGITETNTAYQNSSITQRVRLVYGGEISYAETRDIATDLVRLTNPSDGFMDSVHALRDQNKADIVSLWIEDGGNFCGIGYQLETVASWFEQYAFNVVVRDCATGNYTFGHELGHNMGARHDWIQDQTDNAPYTYNHGHIGRNNAFATIMSYQSSCSGCPRIQYFSNPNVSYNNIPVGVPEGQTRPTNNAKALNNTAATVANFRNSVAVVPFQGDANGDRLVDARDYGVWRQNFGASGCGNVTDFNGDCTVDTRDYGVWRQNFGRTGP